MTTVYQQLQLSGNKWLEKARVVPSSKVQDQVFHYTDAAGLHGMLKNHEIWLTDYRFLNDKSEFVYTNDVVDEVTETATRMGHSKTCAAFVDKIRYYRGVDESEDAFVFSLSERGDDLSQWRGYAHEGLGFAIGFDAKELYRVSKPKNDQPYSFSKIEYCREKQSKPLRDAFDEFLTILESRGADDAAIGYAGQMFHWMASGRGALNKHVSFEGEREWRIVVYVEKESLEIKVRPAGLRLIPYVELKPQGSGDLLPIRTIVVGPGFIESDVGDSVRALLRQNGYANVEIDFAKTPYRRL